LVRYGGEPGIKDILGGSLGEEKESGVDKQATWETLKQQAVERFGPGTVFGEGPLDARLTIVGEAPGQQEVEAERPFVGRAGRLLDQVLEAAGIDRSGIYVTNTVKVRPTTEKGDRLKNRPPRAGEIRAGLEVLLPELRLVAPSVLVLLGNVPAKALINRSFAMGSDRGVWSESVLSTPAIATYHPAYLVRLRGTDFDRTRKLVVSDLVAAWERARDAGEGN
jgi:uracil-DNA glycosylase family 4